MRNQGNMGGISNTDSEIIEKQHFEVLRVLKGSNCAVVVMIPRVLVLCGITRNSGSHMVG